MSGLHKSANRPWVTSANSWLSKNPDTAQAVLDGVFNTRTASSMLGAALGSGVGAAWKAKDKKTRLRNAALGLLLGGAGGYGFAKLAPGTARAGVRGLTDNLITKPLGRIITEVATPFSYDNKLDQVLDGLKTRKADMLKALFTAEDAAPSPEAVASGAFRPDREHPYRALFGLKPRAGALIYPQNPDGTHRLPPEQEAALVDGRVDELRMNQSTGTPSVAHDAVLGNVMLRLSPDKKSVGYQDRWDVNLWRNEKLNSVPNTLRYLLDKFSTPMTFKNQVPLTESQLQMFPPDASQG